MIFSAQIQFNKPSSMLPLALCNEKEMKILLANILCGYGFGWEMKLQDNYASALSV